MVAVVLKLEVDRGGDAGVGEDLGLAFSVSPEFAVAVAVGGLHACRIVTGQAVRNEGVHRGVGALVDLGGELFAVDEVGDGLAHGLRRRSSAFGGLPGLLDIAVGLES